MTIRSPHLAWLLALAAWFGTGLALAQTAPAILSFTVDPVPALARGTELQFKLNGTPGGSASVSLAGSANTVTLTETRAGVYEGAYMLNSRDRVRFDSAVRATLRLGGQETQAALATPLLTTAAQRAAVAERQRCEICGVVQSVNVVEVKGEPGYAGAIAGGVAGAVLGSQIGKGDGRTAAGILGAVGGAYAGREIEKNLKKDKRYDVTVRLNDGRTQVIQHTEDPGLQAGQAVRIVDGKVVAND